MRISSSWKLCMRRLRRWSRRWLINRLLQELAAKNQRIAELEKALAEQTQKNAQLVNAGQNSAAQEREIDSLQQTVQRLERALVEQSHKQTQAPPGQPQPTPDITALQQRIETLEQALEAEHQKYATLETDHEDLLVYMADQDEIMEGLKAQMEALRVQSAQPEHDTSTRETSPQRQPTAEFQQQQQAYYPHEQQAPVVSTDVPEGPNRIYVGELPTFLNEEPVMELLQTFGYLKAFTLIKDNFTGVSTGVAYCEYADPTTTDVACQGLNGMEIAGGKLVVRRADETSVGSDQLAAPQGGYEGPAYATDGQGYDGKVYDANVHSHAHTGHDHGHNHTGHDHHHHHHHHHQAPPPTSGYPNYPTYNYTTQAPSNQTHSPTHTYLATHPYTSPSTPPVHSQQHTYNNAHTQEGYNNGMVQHHQRQHQGQGHGHTSQHGDVTTAEHQQPHPFAKTDTASLFGESAGSFL
ncbi:uncharacterized protein EV422DRAFT_122272 [Fimicolochytrium jonesii]|uniref:uncharacterized protein n=1 Tax=Fimicolochytrium jonesii TaxID=1396493 RepID=UPI0022FE4BD6|nr:uncharacterized protein EV422DRAFT_122272 [Fimicolochytrium jonesii]KAI8819236.1 hypothetical protein EV422DRAFT_122272 [Fimicolochytrium jonesii]